MGDWGWWVGVGERCGKVVVGFFRKGGGGCGSDDVWFFLFGS